MASFYVPEQYAGKTLKQIRDEGNLAFRPDQIGLDQNARLTSGMKISFKNDPGSSEYQFLSSNFTPEETFQANQQAAREQKIQETLRKGSTEAINTLRSGIGGIDQKYQDLLASIRGDQAVAEKKSDTTSAQELARRGIPTSSTYAGQYQQEQKLPITTAFKSQEAQAGYNVEAQKQNINSAVAGIQKATSLDEVQSALQLYQQAEQTRQFNADLAFRESESRIGQEQFGKTLDLQKQQMNKVQGQVVTVGGRVKVINPETGDVITDLGSSSSGSGTALKEKQWAEFQADLQRGITLPDAQRKYSGAFGNEGVVQGYAAGNIYGTPEEAYAQKILGIKDTTPKTLNDLIGEYKQAGFSESDAQYFASLNYK